MAFVAHEIYIPSRKSSFTGCIPTNATQGTRWTFQGWAGVSEINIVRTTVPSEHVYPVLRAVLAGIQLFLAYVSVETI